MNANLKKILLLLFYLTINFAIFGCATRQSFTKVAVPKAEMNAILSGKPEELKPAYIRLSEEGQRNAVLNYMRLGLNAQQLGYKKLSRDNFDKVLNGIEAVYSNNENASKARSLWYEEGMKDFKGEPYERSMAFYYRGIQFLEDRDYENARASFKTGIIQDAFAEEEQNRCDFALLIFLEGWASQKAGSTQMAGVAYKELKKLRPDFKLPSPDDNVLIVVETGTSPRKVADGSGHSELKFRRGRDFTEKQVEATIDGEKSFKVYPMEDIFWQSSTRGGRPVDKILEGKAVFRKVNEAMGTTLTDISSTAMIAAPLFQDAGDIQGASAALGLFGVAQMAIAQNARPHADTRFWDNLPDTVHVYTSRQADGEHRINVNFKDENGNKIKELEKTINFKIKNKKPVVVWVRARNQIN